MYDLIIIGGGPAGIVAGIYGARKNLKTLVLAKDFLGQTGLTGIIENWPGEKSITGPELMTKFEKHLRKYEVETREEKVVAIEREENFVIKTENEKEYSARVVIIATGRKAKSLNVPGEKDFIGRGVVYCTTCDAPLFKNKRVVVAGGGNAGLESAIELTDHTKDVSLFEASSELSGDEFLQKKAKNKGVKIFKNTILKEIKGDNFLKEIVFQRDEKEDSMEIEGLFVQIGSTPIANFIKDNLVSFNSGGEIKIDARTCQTKTQGLFAAGDVTNVKDKQIVVATGEGAKASLSAYNYLKK